MRLILAEKPSVARDLARALGCTRKEQGYFAGPKLLVTWAIGHLVRMAEPAEIDARWGQPWRREALPMLPTTWPMHPEPKTEDQYRTIVRLFNEKRVTAIVNATDAGREGEAIFRRIYALSGSAKPVLRFWTSSLTDEAILEAYKNLRPGQDYDNLAAAAETRARLDWLIGMNHSRAATLHNHLLCSVGRVQTPTLAMIVRRQHEITGFTKTFFYEVHVDLGDFIVRALTQQKTHDFESKPEAEAILAACPEGTPATVTAVEIKPKRTPPPQLHNLGELQKEANRRFGLPADRTLALAQALYEAKAITYPRSSSRHLPEDMVAGLPAVLRALRLPGRDPLIATALARTAKGPRLSKRFIDRTKLSDHHAIIPTAKPAPGNLSADERKVYMIVAERFLGIFLPDKETEETRIDVSIAGHPFRAKGSRLLAPGWTALQGREAPAESAPGEEEQDRQSLPAVRVGQVIPVLDAELVTRERKPPPRYTDATLLSAMETAGREIDDEELREVMRGRGLGTEATRASMIQKLIDLDYIAREAKTLYPTGKGIALIAQTLPHLASPELTGDMEARLGEVEAGRLPAETLLAEAAESLRHEIPAVFRTTPMQAPAAAPITAAKGELRCPKCKAGLLSKRTSSQGKTYYSCARQGEGCTFTLSTQVAGKTLTEAQIRDLCSPTRQFHTKSIPGFTSKAGKKFEATLFLNPATGYNTEFSFNR